MGFPAEGDDRDGDPGDGPGGEDKYVTTRKPGVPGAVAKGGASRVDEGFGRQIADEGGQPVRSLIDPRAPDAMTTGK